MPVANLVDDMTAKGFIALQVHAIYANMTEGMEIRWRNIKIQTENLTPRPTDNTPVINLTLNTLSEQEKAQGVGVRLAGARAAGSPAARGQQLRLPAQPGRVE